MANHCHLEYCSTACGQPYDLCPCQPTTRSYDHRPDPYYHRPDPYDHRCYPYLDSFLACWWCSALWPMRWSKSFSLVDSCFFRRELTMVFYVEWLDWSYDLLSGYMHQVER